MALPDDLACCVDFHGHLCPGPVYGYLVGREEIPPPEQPYAPLASSIACARCGEMTMATRLVDAGERGVYCVPCAAINHPPPAAAATEN